MAAIDAPRDEEATYGQVLDELEADNFQIAPMPSELSDLVSNLTYRPGWSFLLLRGFDRGQGSRGLTLQICTRGYDSYHPEKGENYRVNHFMIVPAANYNRQSWQRWLLDQCLLVERHECCEFFKIGKKRPYAPHHGPGNDPYIIFERGTDEEARTMYTGEVKKPAQSGYTTKG
jgi:hypothetical protein